MDKFDIFVRHGKKGYTGYYGQHGHLHSCKKTRKTYAAARSDAATCLAAFGQFNRGQ